MCGLVNWVCLDLEKNMKNEVHVLGFPLKKKKSSCSGLDVSGFDIFLGWRFDDFSRLVFSWVWV